MQNLEALNGEIKFNDLKIDFKIISLEYIYDRKISLEAICYTSVGLKEGIFKYSTDNLEELNERLEISLSMIKSFAPKIGLDFDKIYKLIIKNNMIYHIVSLD